jgi:membrane-bound lytic murein transglycosylase D
MDPVKSTEAACKYLSDLYGMFHDWQLALASYNCGPGSLRRAIRKSGYKGGFWGIYDKLPRETRAYVPQFIAVMYVMNYSKEHNLDHDFLDFPIETDTVLVNNYLDLEKFALLSDICLEDIQKLNPELKRNAVPEYVKNYPLKIPAYKKEYYVQNKKMILDSAAKITIPSTMLASYEEDRVSSTSSSTSTVKKKIYHTVKRGEVLGSIASKYSVRVADVRKWNRIKGNTIRRGQRLVIYKYQKVKPASDYSQTHVASTKQPIKEKSEKKEVVKEQKSKYYIVQPGDTLWRITQKHDGLTIDQLKRLNNLKGNKITPGMKLVVG